MIDSPSDILGFIFIFGMYVAVVLTSFPQHVALQGGQGWVDPWQDRYGELYRRYDPDFDHLNAYTGGGTIGQTVGVVGLAVILSGIGMDGVAESLVSVSIILTGAYLVYDAGLTIRTGRSMADFSLLWKRSPLVTVAVLIVFAVPHGALYLLL
ncbi:hypothetical protein AB7C87_04875 [Natrarchaeobius sp. A-rgal3]|uniref:hypothetical protein n=1 Tax=Natrarchaeobius versutus TaxID=1679078 RepID=UPI00351032B3